MTELLSLNFSSPEDWFEQMARMKRDKPVDYQEIKRAFDPLNILQAGQLHPGSSVHYFIQAWQADVRLYPEVDTPTVFDAEDWILALVGERHINYFMHKMCEPDGFFMSESAYDVFPCFINENTRRWVGGIVGMRAIAIRLCSWRNRKGLDRTRIGQHASYVAHEVCMVEAERYNEPIRDAITDFFNGQRLDLWQPFVDALLGDGN